MLRIIAGKHKNRIIPTLKNAKYRPSTSKFREALFSILSSGEFSDLNIFAHNTKVLDLFSGTGSLAFEALSRGVSSVTLVDINIDYLKLAKDFAAKIGEKENSNFLHLNALNLPQSGHCYDLVFMDPPYHNNFASRAIESLVKNNWVKNGTLIAVEMGQRDDLFSGPFSSPLRKSVNATSLRASDSPRGVTSKERSHALPSGQALNDTTKLGLQLIKQKIYGSSKLLILKYEQN